MVNQGECLCKGRTETKRQRTGATHNTGDQRPRRQRKKTKENNASKVDKNTTMWKVKGSRG